MAWEENPTWQKVQYSIFFGFLLIMLIIGAVKWWLTGFKPFLVITILVFIGLVAAWGLAALILILLSKLLKINKPQK